MPKLATPLTEAQIKRARPGARLSDGNGLYLVVGKGGTKAWSVRYRLPNGKQPAPVVIGHYPALSLADARARAVEIQRDAKLGQAAMGVRKLQKVLLSAEEQQSRAAEEAAKQAAQETFRAVAARWLAERRPSWEPATYSKARSIVHSDLVPQLGDKSMRTLETKDVKPLLVALAAAKPQQAKKAKQYVNQIVGFAIDEGLRSDASLLRLDRALPTVRSGHVPSITEDETMLGRVVDAIHEYGNPVVRAALLMSALTVVRPGTVASACWDEVDLDAAEWVIPAEKMKTRQPFSTSLPHQLVTTLRDLRSLSGYGEHVFPAQARQNTPHLHRDSLSKTLRDLGFKGAHTAHGFRASFRTLGRERLGIDADVLEAQLAHAPKNEVEAAYARVKFKEQRREVVQRWADYLESLRAGKVVQLKRSA